MSRWPAPGIRVRVALLVTVPFAVVAVMLTLAFGSERDAHRENARQRVLKVAQEAGADLRTAIEVERQFLAGIAAQPELATPGPESCAAVHAAPRPARSYAERVMIVRPDGGVICESGGGTPLSSIAGSPLLAHVLAARDSKVGNYPLVGVDGAPPLAVAMPIVVHDRVTAVVLAAESQDLVYTRFLNAQLPQQSTITVFDTSALVYLRYPEGARWVGQRLVGFPQIAALGAAASDGSLEREGPDGVRRIYGYVSLWSDPAAPLYFAIGIPTSAVLDAIESRFAARFAAMSALLGLMFCVVAWRAERLLVQPVLALTRMAGRIAQGDYAARSGIAGGTKEMAKLGASLDGMAHALEAERARVARAHRALERVTARLESLPAATAYIDRDGRIGFANAACAKWVSRPIAEVVGERLRELLPPNVFAAAFPYVENARRGHAQHFGLPATDANGDLRHAEVFLIPEGGGEGGFMLFINDTTDHQQRYEAMAQLAQIDSLTGLPNRRTFTYALEGALGRSARQGTGLAVLFVDLDRFKEINDTLGHRAGDLVLQTFASCVRKAVRSVDVVGRLGGDEFAVLLEGVRTRDGVSTVIANIRGALSAPQRIDGRAMTLRASIGAAYLAPGETASVEKLLAEADADMYRDKRAAEARAAAAREGVLLGPDAA